jgi:predicted PurR-regulated permease PerM
VAGLPNAVFWGVVTVIVAILPVVGSGLVWAPAVLVLALERHYLAAVLFALWGLVAVGNIDNIIRPWVFRRYAQIHPFVTVIGAFAGLKYFGLLGLLVGPLAISYFFELIRMYREEYLTDEPEEVEPEPPARPKRTWRKSKAKS